MVCSVSSERELTMEEEKKKKRVNIFRLIFSRQLFFTLGLLLQLALLAGSYLLLKEYSTLVFGGVTVVALLLVIYIVNGTDSPEFKIAWIVPVMLMPVFGSMLYLICQRIQPGTKQVKEKLARYDRKNIVYAQQNKEVYKELYREDAQMAGLANYLCKSGGFPVFQNTSVTYFPIGEAKYEEMLRQLRLAKSYIFMEYFIIKRGEMWDSVLEILEEKVKEGVEVRVMYDGMCAFNKLPYRYPEELEKKGIQCQMFFPIRPFLSTVQNNRDHRKILIIDGQVGFTGGINLSDEYINKTHPYGHWKDTAIMLQGDAVQSLILMFLRMWNVDSHSYRETFSQYMNPRTPDTLVKKDGYIVPFGDNPFELEHYGKSVYTYILYHATRYVHIMTPYLILDKTLVNALVGAAKRGVEVKLILPGIPDKKYAYTLAKSHYRELIEAGVEIYEYEAGFVHAKVFVSDDQTAVVGTINLDYRSLYLHFECGTLLYRNSEIPAIEADFQQTLSRCKKATGNEFYEQNLLMQVGGWLLKLVAPLM